MTSKIDETPLIVFYDFITGFENDRFNTRDMKNKEKWPNDRYNTTRSKNAQC